MNLTTKQEIIPSRNFIASATVKVILLSLLAFLPAIMWAQAPPNDNPCQGTVLTPAATCTYVQSTNLNATNSTGMAAPNCANYQGGDVWFRATVPAGGALTFDMQAGTMTDAGMAVYRGNSCVALVFITCDDNSSPNPNMPQATVTGLVPGSTVYVRVWSRGNTNNGTFGICATIPQPAPPNDEPCTAAELTPGATCNYQTFTNASATTTNSVPAPICAGFLGGDVWFKVVVPPATTALIFDTQEGEMTDGGMVVYTGPSCDNLTFVACDDNSSANGNMPSLTVGGLTPGDTVWVRMFENGNNNNGTFGICVTLPPPPPTNDEPCSAVELVPGATCTYQNFTNTDATGTFGAPAPGCANYLGGDVWFKAVVPAGGAITIDTDDGVMTDGGMAIYSGTCNSLTLLNCDDNSSGNGNMPRLTVGGLTPGDTVWIRIWEAGNNNNGSFGICASIPPPAPANDDPCNSIELTASETCTYQNFTNENATGSVGVPAPGCASYQGGDVWFRVVVPTGTNALIFDTQTGQITDGGMAIYRGTCDNLTLLECDDDDSPNGAMSLINAGGFNPGDTIWIRVWEFGGDNNGSFGICVRIPPPPPSNDEPCAAIELPVGETCTYQNFTNENATGTTGPPAPTCGGFTGGDVWFKVVVPAGGALRFDTQTGVVTDGSLAIYSGTCGNLTQIECDADDSPNGAMPQITAGGLTPGDTIWVRFWENGNNNNGTFGICVTLPPPPPANDEPCNAVELTAEATCTYQTFSNLDATGSLNVPAPGCAGYQGGDVWFKVVVPEGGAISIDTDDGTITDGGMAAYRGTCNNLTLIECDDNDSPNGLMPKLTIGGLTAGDTIWVRVWENGNNNNGPFGICVTIPPPPPTNDDPCNAIELIPAQTCNFQTFTNENATNTAGVPAPGCASYQGSDVWFKVVVPAEGGLIFDSQQGVITDGGMAVYSGSCGNLTLVECDDDDSQNGAMSFINVGGFNPGDTLWVRFWEFGGDNNGTFGICVRIPPPPPSNDNPCNAIELTASATCNYQTFTNENASGTQGVPVPGCAGYSGGDVWFKVVVPAGGALQFDSQTGGMTDGGMALYKGSCGSLTLLECDDNDSPNGLMPAINAGGLTPGDTIWVRFWENGNNNNSTFGICVTIPAATGPANDDPCNAITLTPSNTCTYQTFNNTGAINTTGVPAPGCANYLNYPGNDVWFQVTVPAEGGVIVDTRPGGMTDGGMALYTGTCTNLVLVSCDDNNSVNGDMPTIYATGLTPGTTAWIRMWSKGTTPQGTFDICVTIPPPQPATMSFSCPRDTTVNCDNCFSLSTVIPNIHSSTDSYVVNPLSGPGNCFRPYVGPQDVGPSTNLGNDDVYTGVINLPFTFPFFGAQFNALVASTNGYVCFDLNEATAFSHYAILNNNGVLSAATGPGNDLPSALYDRGLIMGPYHDIDPGVTTSPDMQIKYNVTGIAPNRRWVLSYNKVPLFQTACNNLIENTHQIVLYEGSGVVEVFVFGKQICTTWNDGRAMIGMQDTSRTRAIMAPGRRASDPRWGTAGMNESWRFVPVAGPTLFKRAELYDTSGTLLSTADTSSVDVANLRLNFPSVCPATQAVGVTIYVVKSFYRKYDDPNGEFVSTDTIRVTRTAALNADYSIVNADCSGAPTGSIVVTPTGAAPYSYSINGGSSFQSDSTFAGLAPGVYNVIVRDANNCTRDSSITVRAGDPLAALFTVTPALCNGGNGGILINPVNGTSPYQFSADGGLNFQPGNTFTLPAGTYNIRIRDLQNCSKDTVLLITEPTAIVPGAATTAVTCSGGSNGLIVMSHTGGTAPFEYSIDGGTTWQSLDTFVVAAGTYTIRLRDANGCTRDTTLSVSQPAPLLTPSVITAPGCNGGTGTIVVNAANGTGPYSYSIDGGTVFQTSDTFVVTAGSYTLRIRDAAGCTRDTTVVVTEPAAIVTPSVITPAACGAATGSITLNPSGGATPYEYSADGGTSYQTGNSFTLPGGTYTIRVRDANGCTRDTTVIVPETSALLSPSVITPVSCNGGSNGSIVLNTAGGTAPYEYSINGGTSYQTSNSFTVAAGTYTIRIRDLNGCIKDTTVEVTQPEAIITPALITNAACNGATGTVAVNATGGTGALEYSINGGSSYQSSGTFTVTAGSYTIRVRDANGCTRDTTVIVSEPAAIATPTVVTNAGCNAGNGSIAVNASGGATPFEYSINGGTTYQNSGTFTVAAGIYTIRVRDGNGCTKDTTVQVTEPAAIITPSVITAARCNGAADGTITLNPAGGTSGYEYSINGGTTYQPGNSFTVAAGTYTIRVRDANGCTRDTTVEVTQPTALQVTAAVINQGCTSGATGQITVNAAGATPGYSYSIDGTNFQPGNSFTVAAGNYTVTVRDANGCTANASASVTSSFELFLTGRLDTVICGNGRIRLNTQSNATSYSWTPTNTLDDATAASPFASPTETTDYIVTATLGNCTLMDTVRITVTPAPTVNAGEDRSIVKGQDAQLLGTVTNAASFTWSPTTYLSNANTLSPVSVMPQETITYTLSASNAEGCTVTDEVTITVLPYCIKVKNAFTPNGDGVNDNWMVYDQYDCLTNVKVQVFNRYGSRVFQSTNYRNDWRGTYGGSPLPDATYYYVIEYTLLDGTVYQVRGDVTILR